MNTIKNLQVASEHTLPVFGDCLVKNINLDLHPLNLFIQ
jgi:hypothetical protein